VAAVAIGERHRGRCSPEVREERCRDGAVRCPRAFRRHDRGGRAPMSGSGTRARGWQGCRIRPCRRRRRDARRLAGIRLKRGRRRLAVGDRATRWTRASLGFDRCCRWRVSGCARRGRAFSLAASEDERGATDDRDGTDEGERPARRGGGRGATRSRYRHRRCVAAAAAADRHRVSPVTTWVRHPGPGPWAARRVNCGTA